MRKLAVLVSLGMLVAPALAAELSGTSTGEDWARATAVERGRWVVLAAQAMGAADPPEHRFAAGIVHVVHWQRKRVGKLRRSWRSVCAAAGLGADVVPHTLRHTAATWQMQSGVPTWEAAGYLGMTESILREVYGHHHPDHQTAAARADGRRR